MLRQYELVERVRSYDPDADEDLLNRAYVFSMKAHGTQLRASGDPYFSHPIEVAGILTDLRLDDETIATAILHDTIEDTVATPENIERLFGERVARLVEGVTKLSRIEAQSENERAAENLRRFVLAMSDDIRVLLVKLADRLHNMRTLHHIPSEEKRRRIARETFDIYAPLAERIGLYGFMEELRDLAFAHLEPEAAQSIAARMAALRAQSGDLVGQIEHRIALALEEAEVPFEEVRGREKRAWSIFRKMSERRMGFEQLSDVVAFRVIAADAGDCYRALGALHQRWPMVPGRFKDYVSTPKANGYRSIHTTLLDRDKLRIEVQIRDLGMHAEAEYGMAAHWAYKQRVGPGGPRYPWLADLAELVGEAQTAEEVLETTRMAMFQDRLFCFTPRGELIQLPQGATPVDFAYAVHTTLGDTCVGAKVNGRVVSLRTRLANGDQVEILNSDTQTPDPAWEGFVATAKARAAVRRHHRQRVRAAELATGRALYERAVSMLKVRLGPDARDAALGRLKLADEAALHLALAREQVSEQALLDALVPGAKRARRRQSPGSGPGVLAIGQATPGVITIGSCRPVPGDRIIGLRDPGGGIIVHGIDCSALVHAEDEAWIDMRWTADAPPAAARLEMVLVNQPGALAEAAAILGRQKVNIVNLSLEETDRAHHRYVLEVEVEDAAQLALIVAGLQAAAVVVAAGRIRG